MELLRDKIALVTGASKGIGQAIALELARQGAHIAGHYNTDKNGIEETSRQVQKLKRRCLTLRADVTSREAVKEMVEATQEEFGRIDILVNNAGVMPEKYLFRMSDEEWFSCLDTNINGVYFCTRLCLIPMLRQQYGRIITIASISGLFGNPGHSAYGASKAAVIGFTKTLCKEVMRKGITVNAVAPGYIDTGMSREFIKKNKETLSHIIPAGRVGAPEEIATIVAFLASDTASYINGQTVIADGGLLI